MELITFKDIIVFIYQYSIIAIIVIGLIVGIYFCGKGLSKNIMLPNGTFGVLSFLLCQ